MEQKPSSEKRRYVRFNVKTEVKFQAQQKYQGQTPSENVSAITKNLSVEGVCFLTDKGLDPGNMLKLEIVVPDQPEVLHLRGEVMWSIPVSLPDGKQGYETGVKLFTIKQSDETRFIEYVYQETAKKSKQEPQSETQE